MTRKFYKRGEVARRVYKLLHRNPDLTSKEVAAQMPDVPEPTVYSNISRMVQEGKLASRGAKSEVGPNGYPRTHKTYHVKYNTAPKPKPKRKPKDRITPVNPEVVKDRITPVNPEVVKDRMRSTPVAQVMPPVSKAFEDAYNRLAILHTETMAELVETRKMLDRSGHSDCWWCKLKRKFA